MNKNRTNHLGASKIWLALSVMALLLASCTRSTPKIDANSYTREIEQYRAKRLADLTSDNGWLTLIGLFWLREGENKFGSDITNEIRFQQSLQPALCLHQLRNLPLAARAESPALPDRSRREVQRTLEVKWSSAMKSSVPPA